MDIEQWLYSLPLRLRSFFYPNQMDEELKEELRQHLEQQIEENIAKGISPEDARYAAVRTIGGITQIEQQCRDARGGNMWRTLFRICVTGSGNCGAALAFQRWLSCA